MIGDSYAVGLCKWCKAPLANAACDAGERRPNDHDLLMAEYAADLIEAPMSLSGAVHRRTVADGLKAAALSSSDGSVRSLLRDVGLPRSKSLGNIRPLSPSVFLDLMCRLGVKPSQFLAGDCGVNLHRRAAALPRMGKRTHFTELELDELRTALGAFLHQTLEGKDCVAWSTFSAQFGVDETTLAVRFPEVKAKVVAHNAAVKSADLAARWKLKRRDVFDAIQAKVHRGVLPTPSTLDKLGREHHLHPLSPRGRALLTDAAAFWRDLARETSEPEEPLVQPHVA